MAISQGAKNKNKSMGQYPEKVSFIISQVEEHPVPVAVFSILSVIYCTIVHLLIVWEVDL